MKISIRKVNAENEDVISELAVLQERLSPQGDIVSPAGRRLTESVFGEPLTPQQSVERICQHVAKFGLEKVLYYTRVF